METSEDDLGPLPQGDRNAELQKLSLVAFQEALTPFVDRLWFRDERVDDTGVDGSLEVKAEGCHTNLRAQVQMKGTENPRFLEDGTATLQVASSNLNYLLNGPSPIYVMFILPQKELRYAWARDERKRIEQDNPDWSEQGTITLHLREAITPRALDSIRARIISEGRFSRRIHEALVRMPAGEKATLTVDPSSLDIVDSHKIEALLLRSGFSLVNSGLPKEVVKLAEQLPPATRERAKICAVVAYADYMMGQYDAALGRIAQAMLNDQELNATDRTFLRHLRLVCDYHRGRITPAEFAAQHQALADEEGGSFRCYYHLESLRHQLLAEHDPQRRLPLMEELRQVCLRMESANDAGKHEQIQARLTRLLFDGSEQLIRWDREIAGLEIRSMIPAFRGPDRSAVDSAGQALAAWQKSVRETIEEAIDVASPMLVAEALCVKLQVGIQGLFSPFAKATAQGQALALASGVLEAMERDWTTALGIFQERGILDRELQTKMLMADVYEMIGRDGDAVRLASEVLPIAEVMGYTRIAELASETATQRSLVRQFREALRAELGDQDPRFATMTDEQVKQRAADIMSAFDLPASRLGVVERDCVATREVARERMLWCRHIEILQDKSHERSASTFYAQDPNRKCVCRRHGFETHIETPHWEGLLATFKQQYCLSCPDRNAKGDGRTR